MPELPEVETIKLGLEKKIIGLNIQSIDILNRTSFIGESKLVIGKVVISVWRRAKVLGIDLEDNLSLMFHLKMSGQIIFEGRDKFIGGHPTNDMFGSMPNSSTRVIVYFTDSSKLFFNDQRKFGWVKICNTKDVINDKFLSKLGPEPLEKEFTLEVFKSQLMKRKNSPVKVVILDQAIISGIGNIYAAEAVFLAKIDPRKKVKDLSETDMKNLHHGIIKSLSDGVKYKGSSSVHFVNEAGQRGSFLDHAFVYGREGKNCKICNQILNKINLGGRGTIFCPNCQK